MKSVFGLSVILHCGQPNASTAPQEPGNKCASSWETFCQLFLQPDGRIIDHSGGGHSTSEGQVYALFFALINNDRSRFDKILEWTQNNLASGDLTARLMAWKWGSTSDGQWGIIDSNAASDADLWLAYTLFQAGRIWSDLRLTSLARLVCSRITRELIVSDEKLGTILLPGLFGFTKPNNTFQLNPSYQPLFILRGLATEDKNGPWTDLARSTVEMIKKTTPYGVVSDWLMASSSSGFSLDSENSIGSYDAIRVYLWVALTDQADPFRSELLKYLRGYAKIIEKLGLPPERIDATTGQATKTGPLGFSIAIMPYLKAIGANASFEQQNLRVTALGTLPNVYYEQALALFAQSWLAQKYTFGLDGRLNLNTARSCQN